METDLHDVMKCMCGKGNGCGDGMDNNRVNLVYQGTRGAPLRYIALYSYDNPACGCTKVTKWPTIIAGYSVSSVTSGLDTNWARRHGRGNSCKGSFRRSAILYALAWLESRVLAAIRRMIAADPTQKD